MKSGDASHFVSQSGAVSFDQGDIGKLTEIESEGVCKK